MKPFSRRLAIAQQRTGSALCVGLDPDLERIPAHIKASRTPESAVETFCREIIASTSDHACAYKLNFAFFERLGDAGFAVLRRVRRAVPPECLTVADCKRGDIGNSARFYADSALGDLGFDSVTVSPYMGRDSVEPFLQYGGTATFLLVHTSNPGRSDLQTLDVGGRPLYERVAEAAVSWGADTPGQPGFVVGASDPAVLARIRALAPETPFLIPGVGAQGGDADAVMTASGTEPGLTLVNSSRAICYASEGEDFAGAAANAAREAALKLALNAHA
ncbi:MAG: orotidine-5'-phosphate decarboxylase [Rhodothermales bacterium]|nr:orotidine-5'-phosphate decarboxylase [Rhodothermales bacterium]MBO6779821.1 orotidine-5'-phosphate decarboxylase [Rhodothermales bacterium]